MTDENSFAISDDALNMSNDGERAQKRERPPGLTFHLTQEDDDIRLALGMLLKSCQQEKDSTRGCQPAATSTIGASPEWFMTSLRDLRQTTPLTTRESTHSAATKSKRCGSIWHLMDR
jgi:hypothetical protein